MTLQHRFLRPLLIGLACTLTANCSDIFGHVCTLEARAGIVVEIRDGQTATPVADSATGAVVEMTFMDSLLPAGTDSLGRLLSRAAAFERAGIYTVFVTRHGYTNWSQGGVRVTRGECHVNTVRLTAGLQPAP